MTFKRLINNSPEGLRRATTKRSSHANAESVQLQQLRVRSIPNGDQIEVQARKHKKRWSGRPGSNRRRPAWEAGILPLNYSRPSDIPVLSSLQTTYVPNTLSIQSILSTKYPCSGPKTDSKLDSTPAWESPLFRFPTARGRMPAVYHLLSVVLSEMRVQKVQECAT
jgi:hypothetical protein